MFRKQLIGTALALALAAPAAHAQDTAGALVGGVVGSEVAIQVQPGSAMAFSPTTDGTTTALVTIVSTLPSWTLSVHDGGATTPGYMDRVGGGDSLPQPLEWRLDGDYNALSGTPATAATGSLTGTRLIEFRQQLAPEDGVRAGDEYRLTATFRVQ